MHYFFKNLLDIHVDQTNWRFSKMSKGGSIKIVSIKALRNGFLVLGRGHMSYSRNALFLIKTSSLLMGIDQTNWVYSNDNEGRVYQNCKFHDPRGKDSCARAWPYKSYSENAFIIISLKILFSIPGSDMANFLNINARWGLHIFSSSFQHRSLCRVDLLAWQAGS